MEEPVKTEPQAGEQAADPAADIQKELETPISEEEAKRALADLDVARMHLLVVRQKWQMQADEVQRRLLSLEGSLADIEFQRAVIFRRSLNAPAAEKPE